jgi:hypothetical protein
VILSEKCVGGEKEVEFLRYIITSQGMRIAIDITNAIQESHTPQSLRNLQSFLRFANFNRSCIMGFSTICHLLTESTKGDLSDWKWTPDMGKAFVNLKERFTTALILTHYSPERHCIVEIDTFEFAL